MIELRESKSQNGSALEVNSGDLIKFRLKSADLSEVVNVLDNQVYSIIGKDPTISPLDLYRQIAAGLPYFIPLQKQMECAQAIASLDSNTVALGKKGMFYLNIQTVLSAIAPYLGEDIDENNDIVQAGIPDLLKGWIK